MTTSSNLLTRLKASASHAYQWIKRWPEIWAVPLGILIFLLATVLLFRMDQQAGIQDPFLTDPGILQNLFLTSLEVAFINGIVFIGILLNFGVIFDWYKKGIIKRDWLALTPWQRTTFFFILYFGLLFTAALLMGSLQ